MAFPAINDFKEKMKDGGARPSLFEMRITWPAALQQKPAQDLIRFHCRVSEIPGSGISQIGVKFAGREVKFAGVRQYDNLRVTILNDENFTVRKALEAWHEAMDTRQTHLSALVSPTPEGYAGQAQVLQYSKAGVILRSYTFVDLFPVRIDPIPLSWDQSEQIEEYGIEFAYQYWTDSQTTDGITGAIAGA